MLCDGKGFTPPPPGIRRLFLLLSYLDLKYHNLVDYNVTIVVKMFQNIKHNICFVSKFR